ncbi:MAG: hypothetical protein IPM61_02930 [Chlorobi bacterium]|nr:MAG: hypothetical protein UZ07_CHB004001452 [Chlorobi bacterium OLB7]MBK8910260.1 hypothetical protein [Chlorobiota bacterium]
MQSVPTIARARSLWWVAVCATLFGCGSEEVTAPTTNNDLFASVTLAAAAGSLSDLSSSVPDATGQFIYVVAKEPNGPGVFKVPAAGGTPTEVAAGDPFSQPADIVLSTNGSTIIVADPAAETGKGAIYQITPPNTAATPLASTNGTAPVALDLRQESGADIIYYCGTKDGEKAVFKITTAGLEVLHKGAPLNAPTGIVVANDGAIYLADQGTVHRLSGGTITQIATGLRMGSPAGITLTPDQKTLVVSSKSSDGKAQVDIITIANGNRTVFNNIIGANSAPGGLHGARNANGFTGVYSWIDRVAGIYRLGP